MDHRINQMDQISWYNAIRPLTLQACKNSIFFALALKMSFPKAILKETTLTLGTGYMSHIHPLVGDAIAMNSKILKSCKRLYRRFEMILHQTLLQEREKKLQSHTTIHQLPSL